MFLLCNISYICYYIYIIQKLQELNLKIVLQLFILFVQTLTLVVLWVIMKEK